MSNEGIRYPLSLLSFVTWDREKSEVVGIECNPLESQKRVARGLSNN